MFETLNDDVLIAATVICRGILIAFLLHIAISDFKIQKISNRDVKIVAGVGLLLLAISALSGRDWFGLVFDVAAAAILFITLFVFWMLGKVGAGDVKLMATVPIIVTYPHLLNFSVLLLIFLLIILFFIKFPMMMPEGVFRKYIEVIERKGVVPFGVPISAALIVVIIFHTVSIEGIGM